MKLYIAYKFTHVKDKTALKQQVLDLAGILEKKGHSTFVLGRDVQNWNNTNHSLPHKAAIIVSNINKSEELVAFINDAVFSKGIIFELIYAKLTGKKIVFVVKQELKNPLLSLFSSEIVSYNDFKELESALNV